MSLCHVITEQKLRSEIQAVFNVFVLVYISDLLERLAAVTSPNTKHQRYMHFFGVCIVNNAVTQGACHDFTSPTSVFTYTFVITLAKVSYNKPFRASDPFSHQTIPCCPTASASIKASSSPLQKSSPPVSIRPAQAHDPSPPTLQCLQTARWNPPPSPRPPPARTTSPAKPTPPKTTPRTLPSPSPSPKSARLSSTTSSISTAASRPSRR